MDQDQDQPHLPTTVTSTAPATHSGPTPVSAPTTTPAPASASPPTPYHSQPASVRQQTRDPVRQTSVSVEKELLDDVDALSARGSLPTHGTQGLGARLPLPPLPQEAHIDENRRPIAPDAHPTLRPRSGIDYIVPVAEKTFREKTAGERLEPTLLTAIAEKGKYAFKAKATGYALNVAIGLQVLLGALTTGLSAVTTGHQTSIMTAILGGLATLVASYLARARGSNEPELSITRVKDLEQFIRECEVFQMDHGHELGHQYDSQLETLRSRFEELLGNANGERRLSPPV